MRAKSSRIARNSPRSIRNVLVFWPWPRWLLCVLCVIVCICLNYGKPNWPWPRLVILAMTSVCWPWPRLVILDEIASIMYTCVCVCVCTMLCVIIVCECVPQL